MDFMNNLTKLANTVSKKSGDLIESGQLRLQITQLESKVRDKKLELGAGVYRAFKTKNTDDSNIRSLCDEISRIEGDIAALEKKLSLLKPKHIFCPSCNKPIEETAVFCGSCGNGVDKCKCGQPLGANEKFCPACGEKTVSIGG